MNSTNSINEQNLDGALNALFLIEYSRKTDSQIARFVMEQDYDVKIDEDKESKLIARLKGGKSGWNYLMILLGLGFVSISLLLLLANKQSSGEINVPQKTEVNVSTNNESQQITNISLDQFQGTENGVAISVKTQNTENTETSQEYKNYAEPNPPANTEVKEPAPFVPAPQPEAKNETKEEMELPFFNKAGLAHYAKVKEQMLLKIVKIDDKLYAKTEPGATYYKSREVLVAPYVMSQHPVTNLQYKTFLADLAMQGRIDDLKKCLPKAEVWKEFGCIALAKNYFEGEAYNDFPVVNIEKEATILFCEWLEIETNAKLEEIAAAPSNSKTSVVKAKSPVKKKQVVVRLPYDYEWIYSAEAAFSLCPDCGDGYNTIYDPTEGLVDKNFSKRNSQISAKGKRKLNRMDELCDINRFGMSEAEMLSIFQEAMNFKPVKNAFDPAMYPGNIEAHTTAGHVCELIKQKDGGMTVRGCCWKNKEEYNKMMDSFKKNGASPFIGFRVAIQNSERGSDKNPFW